MGIEDFIGIEEGDMMMHDATNNKFKYPVRRLLQAVRANRLAHLREHKDAMKEYRLRMVDACKARLEDAMAGRDVDHAIRMVRPENYVKEYDRAITMFEMTSETAIQLDSKTFSQLVMDEWEWTHSFKNSTSAYIS